MEIPCHGNIGDGLGARTEHGVKSVFDRLGFFDVAGVPIKITTHQFRHYLNTLAQAGGMSQLDIAKWSGRKDIRQNRAYDHVSARDKLALIRKSIGDSAKMFGPLADLPKTALIPRDGFSRLKVQSAHRTDFGYCIHDYTMSPCQIHLDCLNCNELVCMKGHQLREANIRRQQEETRDLLKVAAQAVQHEELGANRWVDHQKATLERLDALCAIINNAAIQTGAIIQLKHVLQASRLQQAAAATSIHLREKASLSIDGKVNLSEVEINKLL